MAQPRKRRHPHHTNTPKQQKSILYDKVIPVTVIIFILFGIGITFFAVGGNVPWLIAGGVIGGGCGFVFGYYVAKGLSKK
jgi:membrane associated rhomboid family serine protease